MKPEDLAQAVKLSHSLYMEALRDADVARGAFVENVGKMRAAGATNQEIGDVLGVSRQRISQMLRTKD